MESSTQVSQGPGTTASATTIGNYGSSVTSAPSTTSPPLATSDLEELLPGIAEIGQGYELDAAFGQGGDASSDREWDDAASDACPELEEFSTDYSGVFTVAATAEPANAARAFSDEVGRSVIVSITDGADELLLDEDQLEELISAINSCDTIRFTNVQGIDVAVKFQAQPDNRYGDLGLVMTMDQDLSGGLLPREIRMAGHVRMFQSGATTVAITTIDGIDPETFRKIPVDHRLAARLAARIDEDLTGLRGD